MSEALEKLKAVGAQTIHKETHIPLVYVKAILDENYEPMTRVQFFGFLSILEREYRADLDEERSRGFAYYDKKESSSSLADDTTFVETKREHNLTPIYIGMALFIFLAALYYYFHNEKAIVENASPLNVKEEVVETPLSEVEENSSVQPSVSIVKPLEEKKVEEDNASLTKKPPLAVEMEPLEILPKAKVWLGYIDVATHRRYQKTFADELDIDGNKEWIMIFGHGRVSVIAGGEKLDFNDKNRLFLHYKNGVLSQITQEEFRALNRGYKW